MVADIRDPCFPKRIEISGERKHTRPLDRGAIDRVHRLYLPEICFESIRTVAIKILL